MTGVDRGYGVLRVLERGVTWLGRRRPPAAAYVIVLAAGMALLLSGTVLAQTDESAPAKPTGLTGTVTHDSVALTWDDPNDDSITGYQVLRRDKAVHGPGEFAVLVDDTGGAATTYTDTGMEAGGRYVYRVKARNAAGLGEQSSFFNAGLPAAPPLPAKPTGLTGTVTHDSVALTWDDPNDDSITGYQALRRDTAVHGPGEFAVLVDDTGGAATAYTDTGVEAGGRYVYRVKARNAAGLSEQSSFFNAGLPEAPEPTPTPEPDTDATRDGAVDLGDITGLGETRYPKFTINGDDDRVDYFSFSLTAPKRVNLGLRQLDFNADLVLEDGDGATLKETRKDGTATEAITATLLEGAYYIRVEAKERGDNEYVLRHGVDEPDPKKVDALREKRQPRDDSLPVFNLSKTELLVEEEGSESYTVSLSQAPTANVTIGITDPTDNSDVTVSPKTLTFTPTDYVDKQVTVSAADDADTDDETATITHSVTSGGELATAEIDDVYVIVRDNEVSGVRVDFVNSPIYEIYENEKDILLVVKLSEPPTSTVTIPLIATYTNGASADDYTLTPGSAVFAPGETKKTLTFIAVDDDIFESQLGARETVTFTFGDVTGYTGGLLTEVEIQIRGTDRAKLLLSETVLRFDEGDTTGQTYTVELFSEPTADVTVAISIPDRSDIAADLDSLTFTPDNWSQPQTVTVSASSDLDGAHDFDLVSHSASGAGYHIADGGFPKQLRVEVRDEDSLFGNLLQEYNTIDSHATNPGDARASQLTTGSAGDDDDYGWLLQAMHFHVLAWGPRLTPVVTLQAHVSAAEEGTVGNAVNFQGEERPDDGEILATFSNPGRDTERVLEFAAPEGLVLQPRTNYMLFLNVKGTGLFTAITVSRQSTVGVGPASKLDPGLHKLSRSKWKIERRDWHRDGSDWFRTPNRLVFGLVGIPYGVHVSTATLNPNEGESASYTIKLAVEPPEDVHITVSTPSGGEVTVDKSSLTFTPGNWNTAQTVTVSAATDDDDAEDSATIKHSIDSGVYKGAPIDDVEVTVSESTVTDDVPVSVSFEQATYTVAEGDDVTVTVTLSEDPERTVTIPITATNESGATSADYSGVPANVTFDSGDTEKTFSFTATDDTVDDDGESVKLGFGTLPAGVAAGTNGETTVSITDDDVPEVEVRFAKASDSIEEAITTSIAVFLSADPERTVVVPIVVTHRDGATADDYSGMPANVVFQPGQTVTHFNIKIIDDNVVEGTETLEFTFGTLPDRVTEGTPNKLTLTITDPFPRTVSFGSATYSVEESDDPGTPGKDEREVEITVNLDHSAEHTFTIPITATHESGATSADYSGVPANVTFNDGDTETTFTFTATDDTLDDDGESVKLGFGTLPTWMSEGTINETTVSITDDDDLQVSVSFESATYTVAEGDSVTVKVTLSEDPAQTVTIPITATNESGASDGDYSGVPANVTFNSGDTEKTFTFTATDDTVDDDDESVKLGFGTLPDGVTEGTTAEAVVSITDDDDPQVSVSFGQSSYTVAEGDDVTVKVTLSADPERTVTIPISRANQGGASNGDYSGVPANVTFNSGDTEKTFSFTATDDTADDDGESVKLGFGTLPSHVSEGTINETTVSINDDDDLQVSVSFEQSAYTVAEGDSVTVKVTLSKDPAQTVTIPISKANQGGASDSDYSGVPANVTFNSGDTEKTFTFTATDDTVDDDDESVKLGFGTLPTGVTEGTTTEAVVSITDNDDSQVSVSFGQSAYTVAEGDSVTVKVTLSADPERTVTIPVSRANQGGASNGDYSGVPANVTFNSGDTEKTFTFTATDDTADDDDESVNLGFGTLPPGVTEGTTDETTVNITDDDDPRVSVSFEQATYTVAEGSSVTVKVVLSADPERTVTIPVSRANQGGASNGDYSGVPSNVTFNSGDTEKTFSFTATDDTGDDDDESVKLGFGSLPSRVSEGSTDETTVNITDDDDPRVRVSFEQSSYTVAEGDSVTVKVTLSADPERTVTIPVSKANQGGASNGDYSGVPANVTFNSGDTEKTFSFTATDDTVDDDDESVKLSFGSLPSRVSEGTTDETTVNITDDDDPRVRVSFEQSAYTVAEGGSVTVKVTLSEDPERTVTIPISRDNQGGAGNGDYSGVPANVTFNSGDTEKTFSFTATDDTVDDDDESVKLSFGTLPSRVSEGSTDETTVNITDDDDPRVRVSFEQSSYAVAEGDSVTVKVVLSADPERTVTIPISKANQGGASNGDYSGVPANVTFNSGDTEKTFSFTATDDTVDDDDESVKLSFGTLPSRVSEGSTDETTVNITDDDDPRVRVSFGQSSYTVAEGSSVTVKVVLSADPERTVTIPLSRANQGGAGNGDYSGVPANVTFNSGDTEKTFSFTATDDTVDDDDESVKLSFGSLPSRVSEGTTDETTVNITDDDDPRVRVSFEQSAYTVAEGDSVTVKVVLSADPERTVNITVSKTNQGGASNGDYSGVPANVTFNSGDTEKTFTFTATDDTVDDDDESVKLSFGTLPTRVSEGTNGETTVNITDDDVPFVSVSFEQATYTVAEGSSVTVKVVLDVDPERTVTIPIVAAEHGGATYHDYIAPVSVTFHSGETEAFVDFNAIHDDIDEGDERVVLSFGTPMPERVSVGNPGMMGITIIDDDGDGSAIVIDFPIPPLAVEYPPLAVEEGNDLTITVELSKAANDVITVHLEVKHFNGIESKDYEGVPSSVTFPRGETTQSFTFTAMEDSFIENDEVAAIRFRNPPSMLRVGDRFGADVTIKDDDAPIQKLNLTCDNEADRIIILEAAGNLSERGERDFWRVALDPYKVYLIEVLGADSGDDVLGEDTYSGDLTLADPKLVAYWNADRSRVLGVFSPKVDNGRKGGSSIRPVRLSGPGTIQIEVASADGGAGTYQIKVRVNNVCATRDGEVYYPWFGGPDGYVLDDPADARTHRVLSTGPARDGHPVSQGGFLGDNWDSDRDEDWFKVELTEGYEYTMELWTPTSVAVEHQARNLKILGIYDSNGVKIAGTSSSTSGRRVSVVFQPDTTGRYYVAVGSEGADRTGLYSVSAIGRPAE